MQKLVLITLLQAIFTLLYKQASRLPILVPSHNAMFHPRLPLQ